MSISDFSGKTIAIDFETATEARALGPKLQERFGQTFVVENKVACAVGVIVLRQGGVP